MAVTDKREALKAYLAAQGTLCVCYSGGVDSALLLKVAHDVLGDRAFAVIADAPMVPRRELAEALKLAEQIGARCHVIKVDALVVEELRNNDKRRCYFCKKNIFSQIQQTAAEYGATAVADGKNADDAKVYRPGAQAASELGVISPLHDAGMSKREIREYSRELGLPTWDKPALACLATRLPYDTEVTLEKLAQVEAAEEVLHDAGFVNVRVRSHGEIARIEAPQADFAALLSDAGLPERLHEVGFRYITLDMEGYRSGSMDS